MNGKLVLKILILLLIGSTILVMQERQFQRDELREKAIWSMEALNSPDISGKAALRCEATVNEAIDKGVVSWDELPYSSNTMGELVKFAQQRDVMKQNAYASMDKLRDYQSLDRTRQIECAKNIVVAVDAGVVGYDELGAEDWYQTINDMANQTV